MYSVYLDGVLLPVAPASMNVKIKNANKTMTLINEGEINFLRAPGLSDVEFEALLPAVEYPFARYDGGFENPAYFMGHLERLKTSQRPFQFIVVRQLPSGLPLWNTNMTVSLEDFQEKEDAGKGFDVRVSVKLKQYRDYGTQKVKVVNEKASVQKTRKADTSPAPAQNTTYQVKEGDCLWNIAKAYYGDGSLYPKIYEANKDKIVNPNLIYVDQMLTIPAL